MGDNIGGTTVQTLKWLLPWPPVARSPFSTDVAVKFFLVPDDVEAAGTREISVPWGRCTFGGGRACGRAGCSHCRCNIRWAGVTNGWARCSSASAATRFLGRRKPTILNEFRKRKTTKTKSKNMNIIKCNCTITLQTLRGDTRVHLAEVGRKRISLPALVRVFVTLSLLTCAVLLRSLGTLHSTCTSLRVSDFAGIANLFFSDVANLTFYTLCCQPYCLYSVLPTSFFFSLDISYVVYSCRPNQIFVLLFLNACTFGFMKGLTNNDIAFHLFFI